MATQLKFGSYVFPTTITPADLGVNRQVGSGKTPRADGSKLVTGYLEKRQIVWRGALIPDGVTLESVIDPMRAACHAGADWLYVQDDRRWRLAQCEAFVESYGENWFGRMCDLEIRWVTGDPFQYSTANSTDTWSSPSSGSTRVVAAGGNAFARPVFSLTVGGAGAQTIAWTFTNTTTGEAFTLAGAVTGGQVIVVDTLLQTVKIGSTDMISLFDGVWPRLAVGNNTLQVAWTSGSISAVGTAWNNRWW